MAKICKSKKKYKRLKYIAEACMSYLFYTRPCIIIIIIIMRGLYYRNDGYGIADERSYNKKRQVKMKRRRIYRVDFTIYIIKKMS